MHVDRNGSLAYVLDNNLSQKSNSNSTNIDIEQELLNLLSARKKIMLTLPQAKKDLQFNNLYAVDTTKISFEDSLVVKKIKLTFYDRRKIASKLISRTIPGILNEMKKQKISNHKYMIIEINLNFIVQVLIYIQDFKVCVKNHSFLCVKFIDNMRFLKVIAKNIPESIEFNKMLYLIESELYEELQIPYSTDYLLRRHLDGLKSQIHDYAENLSNLTTLLDKFEIII